MSAAGPGRCFASVVLWRNGSGLVDRNIGVEGVERPVLTDLHESLLVVQKPDARLRDRLDVALLLQRRHRGRKLARGEVSQQGIVGKRRSREVRIAVAVEMGPIVTPLFPDRRLNLGPIDPELVGVVERYSSIRISTNTCALIRSFRSLTYSFQNSCRRSVVSTATIPLKRFIEIFSSSAFAP